MAWNEPGGNGKDPWGNRGGDKGPPDLDEVFRKLQGSLGGIFGKKGGGMGSGPSPGGGAGRFGSVGVGVILAILLVVWGLSGIYIIQPAERGVVTRFGAFAYTTTPGPHWHIPWPIEQVIKVNVDENRSIRLRSEAMLTQDENIVEIDLAVQYNVKNAENYLFKVRAPDATLQQTTESSIREVIGKNTMDFIITEGRSVVAERTRDLIQQIMDRYQAGIQIQTLNLQDAKPPEAVRAAFDDAIKAREDEQRYINQAEAYSNEIVPRARGDARSVLEDAAGYRARVVQAAAGESERFLAILAEYEKAPKVTRDRLYLDAVESVLSNSSKVLIDVEGGNNLMYLPLDKLIRPDTGAGRTGSDLTGGVDQSAISGSSSRSIRDRSPRVFDRRSREAP